MAASSLEDLLQDALDDFAEAPTAPVAPAAPQQEIGGASLASSNLEQASVGAADVPAESVPTAPPKPAPKGLGLGLGGLDRRPRKPAGSAAAAPATDSQASNEGDDAGSGGAAWGAAKPARKLPADAQRLADDLLGLLHEAGLGEVSGQQGPEELTACLADFMGAAGAGAAAGPGAGGAAGLAELASGSAGPSGPNAGGLGEDDPFAQLFGRILGGMVPPGGDDDAAPPPELAALMQQMMGGGAPGTGPAAAAVAETRLAGTGAGPAGTPGAGPSGSGMVAAAAGSAGGGDDDALASSRLAGLAQQTLKTVSKQAKKTRGHVEGGAAGRPGGAGAGGAGGLPFGSAAGGGGLAAMLRELGGLGGMGAGGGGEGGDGAAPAGVGMMVDYIMQHLLSKDVLYGPLKEIRDRYPPWLEAHQGALPAEEYRRYVAQYESVQRVCAHYETAPSDFAKLMDLIQEMQTYGDPPGDIVEEMTGGAGRDINSILEAAEGESAGTSGPQPALEELSGELDKCKVQ